ncbi:MAG: hypothetical protein KA715_12795 [Xanthomonadaceae bacterium]|nr:hypothetical protein [Xanthomonadaceae bacterium]
MKIISHVVLIAIIHSISATHVWAQSIEPYQCKTDLQLSFDFLIKKGIKIADISALKLTTAIDLGGLGMTDQDLHYLCPLTELTSLALYNDNSANPLTGKTLENLSTLSKLKTLDLDSNQIRANDLYRLKGMQSLSLLKLFNNPLTADGAEGFSALLDLPKLESLYLHKTGITAKDLEGLSALKDSQSLRELILIGNSLGDELAPLALMQNIERLDLTGVEMKTGAGLQAIGSLSQLSSLVIGNNGFSTPLMNSIKSENFLFLVDAKNLKSLDVRGLYVNDSDIAAITNIQSLVQLEIGYSMDVSNEGLMKLKNLPHLKCVVIESEINYDLLKSQLPGVKILKNSMSRCRFL